MLTVFPIAILPVGAQVRRDVLVDNALAESAIGRGKSIGYAHGSGEH
jgi:hypothetical protein